MDFTIDKIKYKIIKTKNYKIILDNRKDNFIINKIKVIKKNGIFITGIHFDFPFKKLKSEEYLGQYGKIININKCQNKIKERKYYSVFVEFSNKISSYLSIISWNNFPFVNKKKLKVSFATIKPCKNFMFEKKCLMKNCIYYHGKIKRNNSILKIFGYSNTKIITNFNEIAENYILKNYLKLKNFIKINKNNNKLESNVFPSIENTWEKINVLK